MFESSGMQAFDPERDSWGAGVDTDPWYHFLGATPDSWIGKLWPRGRAHTNELSQAGIADNFCNAWSGGLNFLDARHSGSEVSIQPNGNVYPCCIKTSQPIGSLLETPSMRSCRRWRETPCTRLSPAGIWKGWASGTAGARESP